MDSHGDEKMLTYWKLNGIEASNIGISLRGGSNQPVNGSFVWSGTASPRLGWVKMNGSKIGWFQTQNDPLDLLCGSMGICSIPILDHSHHWGSAEKMTGDWPRYNSRTRPRWAYQQIMQCSNNPTATVGTAGRNRSYSIWIHLAVSNM